MADWNSLVENYFNQSKALTMDAIDKLIGEFLDHEINFLQEASTRGVAHPDKVGKEIANKEGKVLTISDFAHFQIGKDEIEDAEALTARVQQAIEGAGAELVYEYPRKNKTAIVVLAEDADGKKYAFVKYTASKFMWREKDFGNETGFFMKGTQASKEILSLGPATLIANEGPIAIDGLPEYVTSRARASEDVPQSFAESLPEFFSSVYQKQEPTLLKFDSSEQRNQSLSSVNKYFGEIMAPVLLGKSHMLSPQPSSALDDARENLLGEDRNWTDANAVSYPEEANFPLVDSFLHFDDKKIGVSSKSKKGANPSVRNFMDLISAGNAGEREAKLREAGFGEYLDLVKTIAGNTSKVGPIKLALSMGLIGEGEAQEAIDFIKQNPDLPQARLSDRLDALSANHGNVKISELAANPELNKNSKYRPSNHLIAGIAKQVAKEVNSKQSPSFTDFAKAVYAYSDMVQIYGKFTKAGEDSCKMESFKIIYPPLFDGQMLLNAGKGYTSSGQNDKLTIQIK